jgi:choline dehydrogenase-like flavoprotein
MTGVIYSGADLTADVVRDADVCVIGSGAGGAMLAVGLVERGLSVVMIEAGAHVRRQDLDLQEATAVPAMYQDAGTRSTADVAIAVLQGQTVGGGTMINWTTCFRTPARILDHWQRVHKIEGLDEASLLPHFEAVEALLNIHPWPGDLVNSNNRKLREGFEKLGWETAALRRNVKGCANSGFCGLGCPIDGKQSQTVTTIPAAVAGGMDLYAECAVSVVEHAGGRAERVRAQVLNRQTRQPTGVTVTVNAKVVVVAGGAINSPALLLRSRLDLNGRVGRRTFLHPVTGVVATFDERIEGFYGAPQSVGSHQFIDRGPDKMGFFVEAAPVQPMLTSTALSPFGQAQHAAMAELPYLGLLISLGVDGLIGGDEGGTVSLRPDGRPRLDYPVSPLLIEQMREGNQVTARALLAAGARVVRSTHLDPVELRSDADLPKLAAAPYGAHEHAIFSAHQMGGCAMGPDMATSVVNTELRHHRVANLFVVDGSVLPTALGVNPSETIYALAHRARDVVAAAV